MADGVFTPFDLNEKVDDEYEIEKEKQNKLNPKKKSERLCVEGWLREYIKYTSDQSSPETFHQWVGISVLAAALRRRVWIDRQGYFSLYPNMYIMLIAPQGKCHKSTSAKIGVRLLKSSTDVKMMFEKVTPEGLIAYICGDIDDEGKGVDPKGKKATSNVKMEMAEDGKNFVMHEDSTVYIFASELSALIGSASYTDALIETFTNWYDCPEEGEYTTKTYGKRKVPNVCVNILGCSTPVWLAKGLKEDGVSGGFAGRIIFVYRDSGGKKLSLLGEKSTHMDDRKIKLVHDLMRISNLRGQFRVTIGAIKYYDRWLQSFNPDMTGRLSAYYERKPDHVLKLAMILSVNESDELVITVKHIQGAIKMLEEQEVLMPKAFTFVGATNEARVSQLIIDMIHAFPAKFVGYKRLLGNARHLIKNRREFDDILDMLITSGHVKTFIREGVRYFTVDEGVVATIAEVEKLAEADAKKEMEAEQLRLKEERELKRSRSIAEVAENVLSTKEIQ